MTQKIKINKELISSHFKSLILSKERYVVAFGGRGSGKTKHFDIKYIFESFESKHFTLLYVNKEFSNIRDQQYLGFKNTIRELDLMEYFKFYDGDYRIQNTFSGNWFIPKGMDSPEKTKGIEDVTNIWIDEANKCTLEDITTLDKLLRTPKAEYLQLAVSFNPVSNKHWLKSFFFDDLGYNANPKFKSILIHNSTYKDNEFINQDEYKETLILGSNGDAAKLECDLYGRWGNVQKDNLFIFNFNRQRHVNVDLEEKPNHRIWLSFDFNVNPMTCLVAQIDLIHRWIHIIKEYKMDDSDIYELCQRIKKDYKPYRLLITGDAAGWSRSHLSKGHKNSFQIIKEELQVSFEQIKTPRGKPNGYIADKRNLTNFLFGQHPQIFIGDCPYLIEDLETVQADHENKMIKSKDVTKSHLLDALCDLLYTTCRKWRPNNAKKAT